MSHDGPDVGRDDGGDAAFAARPDDLARTPDHLHFDELAIGWALHALEAGDEELFSAHLVGCAHCQREVAAYEETIGELSQATPGAEMPPGAWERLRARVSRGDGSPVPAEEVVIDITDGSRQRSAPRTPRWLAAAAVVLVLLLGGAIGWNVQLRGEASRARTTAHRQETLARSLLSDDTRVPLVQPGGSTVGYVLSRSDGLDVVSERLPVNNVESTTYVLWALRGKGAPAPLGTFDVRPGSLNIASISTQRADQPELSGYAISKEPGRTAPSAPSAVLAAGELPS